MRIRMIKTGETRDLAAIYAARLIEQGKAVKAAEAPAGDEPAPEKGKSGKKK